MRERLEEHQSDATNPSKSSHIRNHARAEHQEHMAEILEMFNMRLVKPARSALSRQVREAVGIQVDSSHCFLNS